MTHAQEPLSQRGSVAIARLTVLGLGTQGPLVISGILGDLVGPRSVYAINVLVVFASGVASFFALRGAVEWLVNGAGAYSAPPKE